MSKIINQSDQNSLLEGDKIQEFKQSNCFSVFFFTWIYPLLKIGKNKPLIQNDLIRVDDQNCMSHSHQTFSQFYDQANLKSTFYQAFKCQFIICLIFYLIVSSLSLCSPIVTQAAQKYFMYDDPADKPTFSAMLEFVGIQLLYMAALSLIKPFQQFQSSILSIRIQGALQQEILSKTLKFPIARSQHYSTGELINLLQVDVTQASNYYYNAIVLFTCPIQLTFALIVMAITLHKDAISLAIGAVLQAFVGLLFGYFFGVVQKKYMMAKDQRMKAVDESLIHAKQVKLNCLEDFFEQRIKKCRASELRYLRIQVLMLIFINALQGMIGIITWECIFFFSTTLNFGIVNIMIQNYQVVVDILSNLPQQLKNYQMSQNSISRISNFLKQKECYNIPIADQQNNIAIQIEKAKYNWKVNDEMNIDVVDVEEENRMNQKIFEIDLSLQVKKGQYIAFVGNSASGKSTILKSILGETYCKSGNIIINGTISVATQEPWIISGSIKKNITYLNSFDSVKYKKVIKICGLERDLSLFKNGDDTILSEKGDNLSGGQQKRINLARAVYNDADIYLLDDPMSALDIKVKYQIYQQCIQGYLKNKTRILFTNSLSNLQECDMIYIIENGKIVKQGTFAQITGNDENLQYSQKEMIDIQFEEEHYKYNSSDQDLRASLIKNEDQEKGDIQKPVLKQIFQYVGQYWCILCTILYFVIVLSCQLFGNAVMAQEGLPDEEYKRLGKIYYPIIQLPILIAISFQQLYYLIRGLITSRIIHFNVIKSLLNASYTKFYNTILIGRLMNRLSKDIYSIDLLFPTEIQNLTVTLTTLLLPLFACFLYLNLAALPLLIIFFIIMIYLTIIYYRCLREITRIESVSKSPVFSFFQQIVRGITYARACLPFEKILSTQQKNVDLDLGNQINLNGFQYWFQSLAGILTNIFQGILFIICFIFPGKTQLMTNLILNQMQMVSQLLLNTTVSYGNIQMYFISFERCLHLANKIELEDRNVPLITPVDNPNQNSEIKEEQSNIILNLKDCTFQYRINSKSVLQGINFQLHQGEKIGVVGRTGAGKSSIILALTQILEQTEGQIEIEGKNINFYSINELRQKYSIIPQDPIIFMGTLKENLDPLNQFSEAKILEIVQDCGLFEMQSFKQNGLQSEISISGGNLSQGEKQLLNIVRCILEDKQIILVDEATANIDQKTEEQVKQLFEKYFKKAAMLTIAHKVTTIMNSDKIMVINDGQITEFDHPSKLLSNPNSEFKQILDLIKQSEQL